MDLDFDTFKVRVLGHITLSVTNTYSKDIEFDLNCLTLVKADSFMRTASHGLTFGFILDDSVCQCASIVGDVDWYRNSH